MSIAAGFDYYTHRQPTNCSLPTSVELSPAVKAIVVASRYAGNVLYRPYSPSHGSKEINKPKQSRTTPKTNK